MRLKSSDISELIWDIYSGFRGVMAPINSQTEALWKRFEDLEAEESRR